MFKFQINLIWPRQNLRAQSIRLIQSREKCRPFLAIIKMKMEIQGISDKVMTLISKAKIEENCRL
jgi:hypothetical protein